MSDPRLRPPPRTSSSSSASSSTAAFGPDSSAREGHHSRDGRVPRINSPGDLTWLDFLRTTGGSSMELEQPAASTDRKRRHNDSSPERRMNPYVPAYTSPGFPSQTAVSRTSIPSLTGGTPDHAIDLITRPRAPAMPRPHPVAGTVGARPSYMNMRRESDMVLPEWQSDSDVAECPVCHTDFSFWNRRHHCRKCGRVVCAACSPHRITIPHQYIVRPPQNQEGVAEPHSPSLRNLGGGETVRVCNPCVPDPWTPDSQTSPGLQSREALERRLAESRDQVRRGHQTIAANPFPPEQTLSQRSERYRYPTPPSQAQHVNHGRSSSLSNYSQTMPRMPPQPVGSRPHSTDPRLGYNRASQVPPTSSRLPSHHHRFSQSGGSNVHSPDDVVFCRPLPAPPRPPRREVREEDECPVCGIELPPGDALREAHIQECVSSRFSSTPTQSTASAPPQASALSSSFATPPAHLDSRPRGMSFKSRGMAVYRATEKDCTTATGEPQECIICFEEFQPGDELGRMECLCKFHRLCIRQWWDMKGPGSCPTHQLQE